MIFGLFGRKTPRGARQAGDRRITPEEQAALKLVKAYLDAVAGRGQSLFNITLKDIPEARPIQEADDGAQVIILRVAMTMFVNHQLIKDHDHIRTQAYQLLLGQMLRRSLPWTEDDLAHMLRELVRLAPRDYWAGITATLLRGVERFLGGSPLPEALGAPVGKLAGQVKKWHSGGEKRKTLDLIARLTGQTPKNPLEAGDAWANQALSDMAAMTEDQSRAWEELLRYCLLSSGSKPSKRWLKDAAEITAGLGPGGLEAALRKWLLLVGFKGNHPAAAGSPRGAYGPQIDPNEVITERNADVLRGLVWCCSGTQDPSLIGSLGIAAEACFKKVKNAGPRSVKVGNACLHVLASTSGLDAVAQLSRIKLKVKQSNILRQIEKALATVSEATGIGPDELEEIAVPAFGLQAPGRLEQKFGDYTAVLQVTGTSSTELSWLKSDGKKQKSVPAAVGKDFAEELRALKKTAKDIQAMLPAQKARIEQSYLLTREWEFPKWKQRYLDHPLVATLARRLIWHFQKGEARTQGAWNGEALVDSGDKPIDWLDEATRVSLWHPIGFDVDSIVAWRRFVERHRIRQPFKQAHREVYLLTDAELGTATYSNRFAAHIIKQHQFAQLCRQRGWSYQLMGAWDCDSTPTVQLPGWNLSAEFWIQTVGDYGTDTTEAGIYLALSTDQVRFVDPEGQPVQLVDVPAMVFTEVMRDVDLFVSVCSVGNDPAWVDRGEQGGYWQSYSFGDLSQTAQTRKEILERLVPRLRIADRCSFSDKFLVVRGDLRTYKIHLGSGNILMEPNDQYLCIVQARGMQAGGSEKIFLPFEGDGTLSLILSKALLLAEDRRIKDPTIVRQIERT